MIEALTSTSVVTKGETIRRPNASGQAETTREAMAKGRHTVVKTTIYKFI